MTMRTWLLAIVLGANVAAPISLAVTPRVGFAPMEVRVRLTIEPDERNRQFCLSLDSNSPGAPSYPGSCLSLEGARAAKTREIWYHGLPPGDYVLSAAVALNDGSIRRTPPVTLQVLSTR